MVHLLKGKCFDKLRKFEFAIDEYQNALKISKSLNHNSQIIGNMSFRLGWSRIRAKMEVEKGIANLEDALNHIPDNVEILLKLASAIF